MYICMQVYIYIYTVMTIVYHILTYDYRAWSQTGVAPTTTALAR